MSRRKTLLLTAAGALLLHPGARSITLSFLLALLLGGCVQKPINRLQQLHIPRWSAALGLAALVLIPILVLVLWGCLAALQKAEDAADALLNATRNTDWVKDWLNRVTTALPPKVREVTEELLDADSQRTLAVKLLTSLTQGVSACLAGLPGKLTDLGLLLLFFLFCAIGYSDVTALLRALLPGDWWNGLGKLKATLVNNLTLWGTAQLKLVSIIALELTLGLCLLRVEHPVLYALIIAIVDLIPLVGSGLVLLPWAMIRFLTGSRVFAIGLVLLWGVVWGTRTVFEPRFVGKKLQLPSAVSLFSAVLGASIWGLKGLVLFPVLTSVAAAFLKRTKGAA